jgi:AcrR family transcriptional regulator
MPRAARPYHHGDLKNALLQEAARIVETDGVDALSLRELARRLNVSHAAPTSHFADRNALLAELAADGFEELMRRLEEVAQARTPTIRLRDMGRAYVAFARARPGHYRVMFGRGFTKEPPATRLADVGLRAYSVFERAVTAALPPARARSPEKVQQAVFLAWSVTHGAAMLALDSPLGPMMLQADVEHDVIGEWVDKATAVVAAAISESG